jgi:hypothetical protein
MKIEPFAQKQGKHLFQKYRSISYMIINTIGLEDRRIDNNTKKTTQISTKWTIKQTLRLLLTGESYKISMFLGSLFPSDAWNSNII